VCGIIHSNVCRVFVGLSIQKTLEVVIGRVCVGFYINDSLNCEGARFVTWLWVLCHFTGFTRLVRGRSQRSPNFVVQNDIDNTQMRHR